MTLTAEQREKLQDGGQFKLTIDGIECVIVRADIYDRLRGLLEYDDSEIDPEAMYPALLEAWDEQGSPQDAIDYSE